MARPDCAAYGVAYEPDMIREVMPENPAEWCRRQQDAVADHCHGYIDSLVAGGRDASLANKAQAVIDQAVQL